MTRSRKPTEAAVMPVDGFCEKPKRCLTAYNIFFQQERQKLLEILPTRVESDAPDGSETDSGTSGERAKKGRNKKTSHKKIGFAALAQVIATKWKDTPPEEREVFATLAAQDRERYDNEMDEWRRRRREHTLHVKMPLAQSQSSVNKSHGDAGTNTAVSASSPRVPSEPPLVPSAAQPFSAFDNVFLQQCPWSSSSTTGEEQGIPFSHNQFFQGHLKKSGGDAFFVSNAPHETLSCSSLAHPFRLAEAASLSSSHFDALAQTTWQSSRDAVMSSSGHTATNPETWIVGDNQSSAAGGYQTSVLSRVPFPTPMPFNNQCPAASPMAVHAASLSNLASQLDEEATRFMILKFLP